MMIKVEAIVREEVFEDVKEALNAIDVNGITVSQVMGCGAQRGYKKLVRGTEVDVVMQPKIKLCHLRNGRRRPSRLSRRRHIQARLETARYSATRSALQLRSVQRRAAMML